MHPQVRPGPNPGLPAYAEWGWKLKSRYVGRMNGPPQLVDFNPSASGLPLAFSYTLADSVPMAPLWLMATATFGERMSQSGLKLI